MTRGQKKLREAWRIIQLVLGFLLGGKVYGGTRGAGYEGTFHKSQIKVEKCVPSSRSLGSSSLWALASSPTCRAGESPENRVTLSCGHVRRRQSRQELDARKMPL